jgi:hypothetical protein
VGGLDALGLLEQYHRVRRASKLPVGEMLPAGRPCVHGRDGCLILIPKKAAEKVGGSRTLCRQYGVTGQRRSRGRCDRVGDDDGDTTGGVEAEGSVARGWGW